MSQSGLAVLAGVSQQALSRLEDTLTTKAPTENWWEDIDGISGQYPDQPHEDIQITWSEYTFYLRFATEEDFAQQAINQQQVEIKNLAWKTLAKLVSSNAPVSPKGANYPVGDKLVLREGHYQSNEFLVVDIENQRLWHLLYNGRDGDCWDHNNVLGEYIGHYTPLTSELEIQLHGLRSILGI